MKYPKLEAAILLAVFILIMTLGTAPVSASGRGHHHDHEYSQGITVNNYYAINKADKCAGKTDANGQIHPSANVSGLQIGGGLSGNNNCFGAALGAHTNLDGWLVGGSIAKEGKEEIWGIGFNKAFKAFWK